MTKARSSFRSKTFTPLLVLPLLFLTGGILGVSYLGARPLDYFDTGWLWGDLAQVYLAWSGFNSDPQSFLTVSDSLSFPIPMSIAMFDAMPLLYLFLSPFHIFFAHGGQFFGLYFVICIALQASLGYLATREAISTPGNRSSASEVAAAFGGLLTATLPFTFYRFQGHTALSSQWLLALSIFILLRSRRFPLGYWIASNNAVVFLATGINPYLTFMVCLSVVIFLCFQIGRQNLLRTLIKTSTLGITAITGFYLFGFLDAAGEKHGGYGHYSMNALGPFDSNGLGSILRFNVPDATGGQSFEGFTYLGLGVLGLVACSAILALVRKPEKPDRRLAFGALAIVIVSYLLALSTTPSFLSYSWFLPAPEAIEDILAKFRSSGRLFWIGGFWLITLSVYLLYARLRARYTIAILAALLAVQIVDVAGVAAKIRDNISGFQHLTWTPDRSELGSAPFTKLIVLPPWQCGPNASPGGKRNYELFGYFARSVGIKTNNFYAGRTLDEQRAYHCNPEQALKNAKNDELFVVATYIRDRFPEVFAQGWSCNALPSIGDSFACRKEH
ncbi:DUF6311 domain-containing protein [Oricola sp.]|uniref:DUF6311 domain-containing protein n=1 Tax=Oricola sp. TaxID=1979950 RepID=UPI00351933AF